MPFLKLMLHPEAGDPAPLEQALFAAGALSVTLSDAADEPILEPAPGATPLWPRVVVEALFDAARDPLEVLVGLSRAEDVSAGRPLPDHAFSVLEDRAWEREWLRDFRPMRFGDRLWVCPGGLSPPPAAGAMAPIIVELDPGLAFGTGTHPTTALCLAWLAEQRLMGRTVVDYGCGSGILAIAALRLGAEQAVGIDLDPQALLASHDNALRNGVADRLALVLADTPSADALPAADVLLANILAAPLLALAERLQACVRPGGWLVLSGLLAAQAEAVARRYAPWFDIGPATHQDGWIRLDGRRRQDP